MRMSSKDEKNLSLIYESFVLQEFAAPKEGAYDSPITPEDIRDKAYFLAKELAIFKIIENPKNGRFYLKDILHDKLFTSHGYSPERMAQYLNKNIPEVETVDSIEQIIRAAVAFFESHGVDEDEIVYHIADYAHRVGIRLDQQLSQLIASILGHDQQEVQQEIQQTPEPQDAPRVKRKYTFRNRIPKGQKPVEPEAVAEEPQPEESPMAPEGPRVKRKYVRKQPYVKPERQPRFRANTYWVKYPDTEHEAFYKLIEKDGIFKLLDLYTYDTINIGKDLDTAQKALTQYFNDEPQQVSEQEATQGTKDRYDFEREKTKHDRETFGIGRLGNFSRQEAEEVPFNRESFNKDKQNLALLYEQFVLNEDLSVGGVTGAPPGNSELVNGDHYAPGDTRIPKSGPVQTRKGALKKKKKARRSPKML